MLIVKNLITLVFTFGLANAGALYAQDVDESLPAVDSSTHTLFYKLGGGRVVPVPG